VIGTVGILIGAREDGLIDAALQYVLQLVELGQWIDESLVKLVSDLEA
jgi:predicted nucleic acid-binding protein